MRILCTQAKDVRVYSEPVDIDMGADAVTSYFISYTSEFPANTPQSYPGTNTKCTMPGAVAGMEYRIMNNGPLTGGHQHTLLVVVASGDAFSNIPGTTYQNALVPPGGSVIMTCVVTGYWIKATLDAPV